MFSLPLLRNVEWPCGGDGRARIHREARNLRQSSEREPSELLTARRAASRIDFDGDAFLSVLTFTVDMRHKSFPLSLNQVPTFSVDLDMGCCF